MSASCWPPSCPWQASTATRSVAPGGAPRRTMADRVMRRRRPSSEILSGESADVYFARAEEILRREGLDPMVTLEGFARQGAGPGGIGEAKILIAHALA